MKLPFGLNAKPVKLPFGLKTKKIARIGMWLIIANEIRGVICAGLIAQQLLQHWHGG